MTRTYVVGDIPEELAEWHRLCREALDRELTAAGLSLHSVDAHLNDPVFAIAMADRLHAMITEGG